MQVVFLCRWSLAQVRLYLDNFLSCTCSEASVHTALITRTLKCEGTHYIVLYCYVLCTVLLYCYTILMCIIKSVATQFLKSHVVILFTQLFL